MVPAVGFYEHNARGEKGLKQEFLFTLPSEPAPAGTPSRSARATKSSRHPVFVGSGRLSGFVDRFFVHVVGLALFDDVAARLGQKGQPRPKGSLLLYGRYPAWRPL